MRNFRSKHSHSFPSDEALLVSDFNMDDLVVSDMYKTFVKLDPAQSEKSFETGVDGFDSYRQVDLCCPKQEFNGDTLTKISKYH